MNPAIRFPLSDLPLEIVSIIFEYAAQPTFSQKEKYDDENPYSTALSLCLVSRLARHIVLPVFLHTILLRRRNSVKKFANALLMQRAYASKESDLFFDYTSAVKRMWISDVFDYSLNAHSSPFELIFPWVVQAQLDATEAELKRNMNILVPVILAAPALAVDRRYLKLVVQSVQDAWTSRPDHNADGRFPFTGKTKSLTLMRQGTKWAPNMFKGIPKESIFLASIPHFTYLSDLAAESNTFRSISRGLKSPKHPLVSWMRDFPWACMKSLETFSVAYPHLPDSYDFKSYMDHKRGLDLHVERLTISVPIYKQDPKSFPWVTSPFPVMDPGTKRMESDGLSFDVTRDQTHLTQMLCSWDKAWASGLTDGCLDEGVL